MDLLFNKHPGKIFLAKKTAISAISATPWLLILSHVLVIGSLYTLYTKKNWRRISPARPLHLLPGHLLDAECWIQQLSTVGQKSKPWPNLLRKRCTILIFFVYKSKRMWLYASGEGSRRGGRPLWAPAGPQRKASGELSRRLYRVPGDQRLHRL